MQSKIETKGETIMKFDLVVTRHQGLLDYLVKKGLVDNDVGVVIHATADDVKGKKVIGVLPYSLACLTEMFAEVTLELPLELRGKELSLEDVEKHAKGINCYRVEKVEMKDDNIRFNVIWNE